MTNVARRQEQQKDRYIPYFSLDKTPYINYN